MTERVLHHQLECWYGLLVTVGEYGTVGHEVSDWRIGRVSAVEDVVDVIASADNAYDVCGTLRNADGGCGGGGGGADEDGANTEQLHERHGG